MKKIVFIATMLITISGPVFASSKVHDVRQGNERYNKGDFPGSIMKYNQALNKDAESDIINFNIGTAYYKNKDYVNALQHLRKSLLTEDAGLKENVYFNMGNAFYKFGIAAEEKDINMAISSLEQSLSQYEAALKINPKDAEAQYNYDFVKKELERLKKKKQQQKQQQNQQQQNSPSQEGGQSSSKDEEPKNQQSPQEQSPQTEQKKGEQPQSPESSGNKKEQQEQSSQGQNAEGQEVQPPTSPNAGPAQPGQMTEKEAQMLLENYQQTEEPKGLLNFIQNKFIEKPVLKDW